MAVRSDRLAGPFVLSTAAFVDVGPGPNETWVVRTVTMVNSGASASGIQIGIDSVAAGLLIVGGLTVPANGRRVFEEWWAIDYPHQLRFNNTGPTHPYTVTIFGARLAGLA